jgi:hypothetical protein
VRARRVRDEIHRRVESLAAELLERVRASGSPTT